MTTKPVVLCAATALTLASAEACGPDFQISLTSCGTQCLQQVRTAGLREGLAPIIAAAVSPLAEPEDGSIPVVELEKQGLKSDQQTQLASMRDAANGDAAYEAGSGLPPAIRLYTAGAVDFLRASALVREDRPASQSVRQTGPDTSTDDPASGSPKSILSAAIARFEAATAIPESQSFGRVLWAEYLLGRAYRLRGESGDLEASEAHFRRVLSMVQMGSRDPMTLGNAALGELGRIALVRKDTAAALALYAQQAHSPAAVRSVNSLVVALHHIPQMDTSQLAADLRDPLQQRLIVAYGLSRVATNCDTDSCAFDGPDRFAPLLLAALKTLPQSVIVAGDQIAALAYAVGDYDFAERTVALTQSPLADWIQGKLALHRGALQEADAAFGKAATHFQTEEPDAGVGQRFHAEWGVLKLARSDYMEAMNQLLTAAPDYQQDIAYIAERVLTISELKQYVDAHPDCGALLNSVLATRLARAGRVGDAIAYYPEDKGIPEAYAQALDLALHAGTSMERARAWYAVARMDIVNGMDLLGAQLAPDGALWNGNFETRDQPSDLASLDEKRRFEASKIVPDRRFHYRAIGVKDLLRAVDELPKRSAVSSAVLCQGARLLRHHGEAPGGELINELYRTYKKVGKPADWDRNFGVACPEPEFPSVPQSEGTS